MIQTMFATSPLVLIWAILILAAAGCSRFDDGLTAVTPEPSYYLDGLVRTDADAYEFVEQSPGLRELTVEYTIRNPGFSPLYLARCGGGDPAPALIKFHDGAWIPVLGWACPAIWTPPIRIGPGEAYRGVGRLILRDDENSGDRFPPEIDVIAGTYKLALGVYSKYDQDGDHRRADPRLRLSNEFWIEQ